MRSEFQRSELTHCCCYFLVGHFLILILRQEAKNLGMVNTAGTEQIVILGIIFYILLHRWDRIISNFPAGHNYSLRQIYLRRC